MKLIFLRFHEILIWPAIFFVVLPRNFCVSKEIIFSKTGFFLGKGKTKAGTMMMMTKEAKWTLERMTKICLTFAPMNMGKNLPQKSINA